MFSRSVHCPWPSISNNNATKASDLNTWTGWYLSELAESRVLYLSREAVSVKPVTSGWQSVILGQYRCPFLVLFMMKYSLNIFFSRVLLLSETTHTLTAHWKRWRLRWTGLTMLLLIGRDEFICTPGHFVQKSQKWPPGAFSHFLSEYNTVIKNGIIKR